MEDFGQIERYLNQRMREFFAPFSSDFRLSILPAASSTGTDVIPAGQPVSLFGRGSPILSTSLDVVEKDKTINVRVELPGVKKEDIQVHIDDNILTVQAERKESKKEEAEKYHYSERSYGKIRRSIALPAIVDPDKVKTVFENGVLGLEFTKKPEEDKRKKITIS